MFSPLGSLVLHLHKHVLVSTLCVLIGVCISYLPLYNVSPQNFVAKISDKWISFHSFCGAGIWVPLSWVCWCIRLYSICLLGWQSSQGSPGEGAAFKLTHVTTGKTSGLHGLLAGGSSSSVHESHRRRSHNMTTSLPLSESERKWEPTSKREATVFLLPDLKGDIPPLLPYSVHYSLYFCPTLKGREIHRVWILGSRDQCNHC